jgi:hypothetical protein
LLAWASCLNLTETEKVLSSVVGIKKDIDVEKPIIENILNFDTWDDETFTDTDIVYVINKLFEHGHLIITDKASSVFFLHICFALCRFLTPHKLVTKIRFFQNYLISRITTYKKRNIFANDKFINNSSCLYNTNFKIPVNDLSRRLNE